MSADPTGQSFELCGAGWSASFQRAVLQLQGEAVSPNRGRLPCHPLERSDGSLSVIVPLPDGESVWLAFTLAAGLRVAGWTGAGTPLLVHDLGQGAAHKQTFFIEGIMQGDGSMRPICPPAVAIAATRQDLTREPALRVELRAKEGIALRLSVTLTTPELYSAVTGFAVPQAYPPEDAYRGWRLP